MTLLVGDVFLKIDADQANIDVEVEAMALAPLPAPEIPGRKPPVLALAALPGWHSAVSVSRRRRGPRQVPPSERSKTRLIGLAGIRCAIFVSGEHRCQ